LILTLTSFKGLELNKVEKSCMMMFDPQKEVFIHLDIKTNEQVTALIFAVLY
jgi:hypothetical protein